MSLTIIKEPNKLSSVNNSIPIVLSSEFATEPGFKYKIDLLDISGTTEYELFIYPDSNNNNYCIFNFNQLLSDDYILTDETNWNITGWTTSNLVDSFNWRATEYIGDESGDSISGSTYWTFRGVFQYNNIYDISDYIPDNSTKKFLSNKISRKYKLTETALINAFSSFNFPYTTNWSTFNIQVYTKLGNFTSYYNITPPENNIIILPIGPYQINQMSSSSIFAGYNSNILDEDTLYYDIWLGDDKGGDETEKIRIYLDHECYKHDSVIFHYLGDLSTYETMAFRMADIKTFEVERNEIKSNYYSLKNNDWTYNYGDRGRKNIDIKSQEKHSVISGWIDDDESKDIFELIKSQDVYIIKNNNIYPVIITSSSYEVQTIKTRKLFNYTINFEMAYNEFSNL